MPWVETRRGWRVVMASAEAIPIIIFARAPIAGKSKRRLIPALGPAGAAKLHTRMLEHMVDSACRAGTGPVLLYVTPTVEHESFAALARRNELEVRLQQGVDLGERMAAAFESVLAAYPGAVLIGSDCPGISVADLRQAARIIHEGADDAVLGPTVDGGYCLIGLGKKPASRIFEQICWGQETVLAKTRKRMRESELRWVELAVKRDIDRPEDLVALPRSWPEHPLSSSDA